MNEVIVVRKDALAHVSNSDLRTALRSGRLQRVFRGVYLDTASGAMTDTVVRRAALRYADRNLAVDSAHRAVLCCESAGAEWALPMCKPVTTTLSIPRERRVAGQNRLQVHRHKNVEVTTSGSGLRTASKAQAIVQSFNGMPMNRAREMVIRAVQDGLVTAGDVLQHVPRNLAHRQSLLELLQLAGAGSHSELEIAAVKTIMLRYGLDQVFEQQYTVHAGGRRITMDFASARFKVNLETDGSRFHSSADARSRDNRRDLALRKSGWLVIRALYELVVDAPEAVAAAVLAALLDRGWPGRPTTLEGRLMLATLTN